MKMNVWNWYLISRENHSHLDVSFLSKLNGSNHDIIFTSLHSLKLAIHRIAIWVPFYWQLKVYMKWYEEGNHLHVWFWHIDYWKTKKWNSSSGYCYLEVYNHGLQLLWGSLLFSLPINYPVWCGQKTCVFPPKVKKSCTVSYSVENCSKSLMLQHGERSEHLSKL